MAREGADQIFPDALVLLEQSDGIVLQGITSGVVLSEKTVSGIDPGTMVENIEEAVAGRSVAECALYLTLVCKFRRRYTEDHFKRILRALLSAGDIVYMDLFARIFLPSDPVNSSKFTIGGKSLPHYLARKFLGDKIVREFTRKTVFNLFSTKTVEEARNILYKNNEDYEDYVTDVFNSDASMEFLSGPLNYKKQEENIRRFLQLVKLSEESKEKLRNIYAGDDDSIIQGLQASKDMASIEKCIVSVTCLELSKVQSIRGAASSDNDEQDMKRQAGTPGSQIKRASRRMNPVEVKVLLKYFLDLSAVQPFQISSECSATWGEIVDVCERRGELEQAISANHGTIKRESSQIRESERAIKTSESNKKGKKQALNDSYRILKSLLKEQQDKPKQCLDDLRQRLTQAKESLDSEAKGVLSSDGEIEEIQSKIEETQEWGKEQFARLEREGKGRHFDSDLSSKVNTACKAIAKAFKLLIEWNRIKRQGEILKSEKRELKASVSAKKEERDRDSAEKHKLEQDDIWQAIEKGKLDRPLRRHLKSHKHKIFAGRDEVLRCMRQSVSASGSRASYFGKPSRRQRPTASPPASSPACRR